MICKRVTDIKAHSRSDFDVACHNEMVIAGSPVSNGTTGLTWSVRALVVIAVFGTSKTEMKSREILHDSASLHLINSIALAGFARGK